MPRWACGRWCESLYLHLMIRQNHVTADSQHPLQRHAAFSVIQRHASQFHSSTTKLKCLKMFVAEGKARSRHLGTGNRREQGISLKADGLPGGLIAAEQRRRQRLEPGLTVSRCQQQARQHLLEPQHHQLCKQPASRPIFISAKMRSTTVYGYCSKSRSGCVLSYCSCH